MTTATRHNTDNDKMADRTQKRRALTKVIQILEIKNDSNINTIFQDLYLQCAHAR